MKLNKVASIILTVIGVAGAILSVSVLISAIQFSEWGRVIFYCVALGLCVELAVWNILKLKAKRTEE